MPRSLKKGPFISPRLQAKMEKFGKEQPIKTWSRSSVISPEMIGYTFRIHNGKDFITVKIREDMVGHKLGEFSPTTKFVKHGGKMQKALDKNKGRV
jgi:small subunit ribosomal protein S19